MNEWTAQGMDAWLISECGKPTLLEVIRWSNSILSYTSHPVGGGDGNAHHIQAWG